MQNPLDSATIDEIQNLIKSILGTFTTNYVKQYALGLVKKAEEEAMAEPGPAWQLLERPETDNADPLKTGWLMKKGAIRKSWKKRWHVVHPNYVVEYFENEKAAQGPKPKSKGKMYLSGYRVVEDPNAGIIQQLEKIAKQMSIDTSELPKPKQYPELVFELHHPRRRCYFIEASTKEEKQEWMDMFRTVCWYAWGLENRDPIHMNAFNRAIVETRWHLGRWGWWSSGGSETQLLSDLINDEIEYQTIGKIFAKIGGVPWIIRSKIRDQVLKTIDGFVSAGVTPAWAAMAKTVEEIRPKIEPTIAQMVDPLGKQKAELINKMKDGCMSIIQPLLEQNVKPHLQKILDIIKSPVVKGYEQGGELLVEQFGKVKADSIDASFKELDQWSRWSWWNAKKATEHFDKMYDPLWALHIIFDDIYPWSTIYNGQDQLRKILDNAIYTYEVEVKKAQESKSDSPLDHKSVMTKYQSDAKLATIMYYLKIFKDIIMPAFNKTVIPACKAVIDPLSEIIPEPMKQFIDPSDMFDKFINALIDDTIKVILA